MNPNVCEKCERALDFWTDGNGKLIAIHPVTPCVPRASIAPELHVIGECPVCEDAIYVVMEGGRPRKTCGKRACEMEYRNGKQERLRALWREANRKRYARVGAPERTEHEKAIRREQARARYHAQRKAA